MADFKTILKVEDHSLSRRSLKDIFTSLVDDPKQYPCKTNRRHYFLVFESMSAAEHAFSHRRNLEDVSVLLVDSCSMLIEQCKEEMYLDHSSRTTEHRPRHGIAANTGTGAASTLNISPYITRLGSSCGDSGSPRGRVDQLYAHRSSCDPPHALPVTQGERCASPDSVASSVQDKPTVGMHLRLHAPNTSPSRGSAPGLSLLQTGPTNATPLTCESRIFLSLCGEIIAYDLKSEPSNPDVVIELLRATKSERGNYMIAGAFYRRMGHPQSAKAVLISMLEEFSVTVSSDCLRSGYLLLSGCELDMARINKASNKDASAQYEAAQIWLQKVFGKSRSRDVSAGQEDNRQELGTARSAADNRICTCSGGSAYTASSRDIDRIERENQSLRDRNANQQKQLSNLRSMKRKLEDDVFYERDMRRKYQRRLEDLERKYAQEKEAHALELATGHVDRI